MTVERYTKNLIGRGYRVIGGNVEWDDCFSDNCSSIKMSVTCSKGGRSYSNIEELIKIADSDLFLSKNKSDFCDNFPEIMRGNRPDWKLTAFDVFVGGVELYYRNSNLKENGFLWITEAKNLQLTFIAPQTRLGFKPFYKVSIEYIEKSKYITEIEEDLGYIRFRKEIKLKNPYKKSDGIFHEDNQIMYVTEYVGF